ncbi:MAG: DNA cytosine methyltransferase [Acidobacteriota bacterium]
MNKAVPHSLSALDFFAGSGLVRLGLEPEFTTVWANDLCSKKQAVYKANFPADNFCLGSIENVNGVDLPPGDLAWASFPCQDLSLAGNLLGMGKTTRSGLFWQWIRVLDELAAENKRPPILIAENVVGFLVANECRHFVEAYKALRTRGYRAGAVVVDARLFLPQSRPRAFLIAVSEEIELKGMTQASPSMPFHTAGLVRAAEAVGDPDWIWWNVPIPQQKKLMFSDLCEREAPCDPPSKTRELRRMLSRHGKAKLEAAVHAGIFLAGTGYRRTRPDNEGKSVQRLEIRFDGVAGCLRTPEGGSSRQVVMIVDHCKVHTRLMTVRECARLMGAPDTFEIPGSYNDGYRAMGDAVAVPVTRWVTRNLLAPLAGRYRSTFGEEDGGRSASPSAA